MDGETYSQKCTAAHIFTKDDPIYAMDIRMRQFYSVQTGYKIWSSKDDPTVDRLKDGDIMEFMYSRHLRQPINEQAILLSSTLVWALSLYILI